MLSHAHSTATGLVRAERRHLAAGGARGCDDPSKHHGELASRLPARQSWIVVAKSDHDGA